MLLKRGSLEEGSMPVGPIEPATKRRCWAVVWLSATRRAMRAAVKFISWVSSPSPYSSSFRRLAVNESVSITSQPASRKPVCISSITLGLVRTRYSLQPSGPVHRNLQRSTDSVVYWCPWLHRKLRHDGPGHREIDSLIRPPVNSSLVTFRKV